MVTQRSLTALAAAALLTAFCAGAWAVKPIMPPSSPLQLQQPLLVQAEPTPPAQVEQRPAQAAPLPPERPKCVAEKSTFTDRKTFVVELTNGCDVRMRCTLHAYVVNSRGPMKGSTTLTLAPSSEGPAARKAYVMKLKENHGSANVSRSCQVV